MIRTLLSYGGFDGLLTRMARFEASNVDMKYYKMADLLIKRWDEREVANVSLEAAGFWNWVKLKENLKCGII